MITVQMIIIEMGGSTLFLSSTKPCTFSSWDQNPLYAGKMGFVKSRARNFEKNLPFKISESYNNKLKAEKLDYYYCSHKNEQLEITYSNFLYFF